MSKRQALAWRYSLALECWFYYRACQNWQAVISARRRQTQLDRFVLRNGAVIAFAGLPPFQIFQEIYRRNLYTREYPRGWRPPRTVIDIGANIGFFSICASNLYRQANIYAYEPAPENFLLLQKNILASRAAGLRAFQTAVAGVPGRRELFIGEDPGWHSFWHGNGKSSQEVETTTLDEIISQSGSDVVDFLKMDCEGAEYEILRAREKLLGEHVRFIAMEYHEVGSHSLKELKEIMTRAQFAFRVMPDPQWHTGMLYARNLVLDRPL